MYLSVADKRPTQDIDAYVEDWCLEELTVSPLSVHVPEKPAWDVITRTTMVKIYIKLSNRRLISVSLGGVSKYIQISMGIIPECCIVDFDTTWRTMISFRTYSNSTD